MAIETNREREWGRVKLTFMKNTNINFVSCNSTVHFTYFLWKYVSLKNITICKSIHVLYTSIWYGADTCVDKFQNAVPVGITSVPHPQHPHWNIYTEHIPLVFFHESSSFSMFRGGRQKITSIYVKTAKVQNGTTRFPPPNMQQQ